MNNAYNFLKPYCHTPQKGVLQEQWEVLEFPYNSFGPLEPRELEEAETLLGMPPFQLKNFYTLIGSGCLLKPPIVPKDYKFYGANEILPPLTVARFAKGILTWEGQEHWIAESVYALLQTKRFTFF